MSVWFDRFISWIANRVSVALGIVLLFSVAAAIGYLDPLLPQRWWQAWTNSSGVSTSTSIEPEERNRSGPRRPAQVSLGGDVVLIIQSPQIFSAEGVAALRDLASQLEDAPYVQRVNWLETMPSMNLFGLAEPLFPRVPASPARYEKARERALEHPFLLGQMLSQDAQTTLFLIQLDFLMISNDRDTVEGIHEIAQRVAAGHAAVPMQFTVTGRVPITLASLNGQDADRLKYQLIGYSIIILMSIILFRGISAVVIVSLAAGLGVFWTTGLSRFMQIDFNPLVNVILPVLVSLVGFTDGVHLMTTIRRLRARGATGAAAAAQGMREVGLACFLTSLTTAIGLGSLVLAEHQLVKDFGRCSVVGVTATFFAVITVIPLACRTPLGRRLHVGYETSLVERQLGQITKAIEWVMKHRRMVTVVGIVLWLILCGISATLRPDQRLATTLPAGSEAAEGMRILDSAMGGLETSRVEMEWDESRPLDAPELEQFIAEVDRILQSEQLLGHPVSIRTIASALAGNSPRVAQLSLASLLPDSLRKTYFEPEQNRATTTFRVQDLGIAAYAPVFERVSAQLEELQQKFPGFRARLGGAAVSRWENLYQIVVDLLTSLGSAALIIFVVLGIAYRSLRLGLISIVPNLFPLAVAGTYLVWQGAALEIVTVCAFTVCLGIAVDDTIHFLSRYQEQLHLNNNGNHEQAIREAFTSVGTALIITTVVLVAGFASVLTSDARDQILFASMGMITIGSALLGDLILLPAMLAWFVPRPPALLPPADNAPPTHSDTSRSTAR